MTDVDYVDDLALFVNTPAQAESLLHKQDTLASTWTQIKQCICVLNKKELSRLYN